MKTPRWDTLQTIAHTIRALSLDIIGSANSGHPGLPLGCAELGAYLYGHFLRHDPSHPNWLDRDRFVLSAGHGSALLYACLHLAGFGVTQEQLSQFRQYGSPTAGHPEYKELAGIETTTGPLGQGIATAVGMALAHKMTVSQHNIPSELLQGHVIVLAGDGCMMEGISSEASSFAGHLKLDNLILIYDANGICLDGSISECFTEDVAMRYRAYGWTTLACDGHDLKAIDQAMTEARACKKGPVLIVAHTTIGKGSPSYAGSSEAHGKAFSQEEVRHIKRNIGFPENQSWYIPHDVETFFLDRLATQHEDYQKWDKEFEALSLSFSAEIAPQTKENLMHLPIKAGATRQHSGQILQFLQDAVPYLVGGSADLSCSDNTWMARGGRIAPSSFEGRNIKFGVREFAMASICSGIAIHGVFRPYCGTFLTFSDYMKNAIRLAALMKLPVVYQLTHDSFLLGEDGPTHQPIEQLASLRSIPGLVVIRPADEEEVKGAWLATLLHQGPCALILSRQTVASLAPKTRIDGVLTGAYVIKPETRPEVDVAILATGSEVQLALDVATRLEDEKGWSVRVVSFPSFELFEAQGTLYKKQVLGGHIKRWVSIEAQSSFGWHRYIGKNGLAISRNAFGMSGKQHDLAHAFGFTTEAVLASILHHDYDSN